MSGAPPPMKKSLSSFDPYSKNAGILKGVSRGNLNGEFNVPRGTKNKVVLPDDNWIQIASYLKNSAIICADFERTIKFAGKGDFILADPPYAGPPGTNTFTKYGSRVFSWNDQARLASALKSADSRGATFLVTNTPHTEIRDIFDECNVNRYFRSSLMPSWCDRFFNCFSTARSSFPAQLSLSTDDR